MANLVRNEYPSKETLAAALAERVANALDAELQSEGRAVLAVSGGSTPKRFFDELSQAEIDWAGVTVTLVDERWVPETDDRSNAQLVKENLLKNQASAANFFPLYSGDDSPELAVNRLAEAFDELGGQLTVAVLGMGPDGHTASFFAQSDNLLSATDPENPSYFSSVRSTAALAQEPRMTFTLPPLTTAGLLALHIEGDEKAQVLRAADAEADGSVEDYPIRAVLQNDRTIEVYWCP